MSAFDGILFGIGSALSVFPGVSRIGGGFCAAIMRGADPQHAYKWTLILSVPTLFVLSCFDLFFVFTYLSAVVAITFMKTLTSRAGLAAFSYYSWGAALFAFILYLY